ncbi:dephospho-CoA kinase [Sporichthya sp.]|uniref:dephospho-CoA kinase n=1 Tax=Sporichthya sp. TaxID=65475 RepID=UPI001795B216|nr:dephospho-CoA kinase [Sporichthya sp.]MBA3745157.1 dephospho-CoA kinase [Sporichthya sp.]
MLIGLTGGIGSGKTTVSDLLGEWGAVIVDADVIAREVVAPGSPGLAALAEAFGPEVLGADGGLDRERMAAIAFADPQARARLNGIVHPLVRERAAAQTAAAPPGSVVVQAVPLLAETAQAGQKGAFDLVVVVDVDADVALDRLVRMRGMTPEDAAARMAAQASREQRLAVADVVLDNSGDLPQLEEQVAELWREVQERA